LFAEYQKFDKVGFIFKKFNGEEEPLHYDLIKD
jgi:hypothetical protein